MKAETPSVIPPVMNIREAAQVLRVSPATVRRLIRGGHLRAIRILRRVVIRREDLEAFLQHGTEGLPVLLWLQVGKAADGPAA